MEALELQSPATAVFAADAQSLQQGSGRPHEGRLSAHTAMLLFPAKNTRHTVAKPLNAASVLPEDIQVDAGVVVSQNPPLVRAPPPEELLLSKAEELCEELHTRLQHMQLNARFCRCCRQSA